MKLDKFLRVLTTAVFLLLFVSAAHAENWVEVFSSEESGSFARVDVDSIRKADDGIVYFSESTDIGGYDKAVDCQKRISYLLGKGSWKNPDWRSKGSEIIPGSNGGMVADFVCSRAP